MFILDTGNLSLDSSAVVLTTNDLGSLCFNFSYEMVTIALLHSTNVEHLVYTRHSSRCWEVGRGTTEGKDVRDHCSWGVYIREG